MGKAVYNRWRLNGLALLTLFLTLATSASSQPAECQAGKRAVEKKTYGEAVSSLNRCLDTNLSDSQRILFLQIRAKAYHGLNELPLAIEDQEKAVTLDTANDAWPWIRLSIYQREDKHYGKALAAINEAENRDENGSGTGPGAAVYYHKGWALHEAGRPVDALIAFTKAIARNPNNVWLLYRRALAYEALDNRVQAKRDLARVAELIPKDGYEASIVRKLKKYGFRAHERRDSCLPPDVDCEYH